MTGDANENPLNKPEAPLNAGADPVAGDGVAGDGAEWDAEKGAENLAQSADQDGAGAVKRPAFRKRKLGLMATGVVALLLAGVWSQRTPIGTGIVNRWLQERDIEAQYEVRSIGVRSQRIENLVIGPKAAPDLQVKLAILEIEWGLWGPRVKSITADGVRLRGEYKDDKLSFGEIDKFSDPESDASFELPDIHLNLNDARAVVTTPYGPVGLGAAGVGNLRNGFKAKLALAAPELKQGNCRAEGARFTGDIRVDQQQLKLTGPLYVESLGCGKNLIKDAKLAFSARSTLDVSRWQGDARLQAASLQSDGLRAQKIDLDGSFEGGGKTTYIRINGGVKSLASAQGSVDELRLRMEGDVGLGRQMFDGRVEFNGASLAEPLRQSLALSHGALEGTPLEPLAKKFGQDIGLASQNMSGSVRLELVNDQNNSEISFSQLALKSASGAQLTQVDGRGLVKIAATPQGMSWTADGQWQLRGGGLPSADMAVRRGAQAQLEGRFTMQPYQAGGAKLAIPNLQIIGNRSGDMRFQADAIVSGPFSGGRVDEATIPIKGRYAANGQIAMDGGCHQLRARSMFASGYQFNQPQISLCSAAGRDLLRYDRNGLSGQIHLPSLSLHGQSADGANLQVKAGQSRFDLGAGQFAVQNADIRLISADGAAAGQSRAPDSQPDVPTHFAANQITGRLDGAGLSGKLLGADARIAAVPLNLSEIEGDWRFRNGAITLGGQIVVSDADPDPRFSPLISPRARLRFVNGKIFAMAPLFERKSNHPVVSTFIRHRFDGTGGEAKLLVKELRFDEDFQPDQLTRLAFGVIADVDGSVVGDAFIRWNDAGVDSGGTFATANMDLAAAFGPVSGLTGTIIFDDLLDLKTRPSQKVSIREVNPGIAILDGEIEYQLTGGNKVRIEEGRWPIANGQLLLHPAMLNFAEEETRHLSFEMLGIDASAFLQRFGFDNLNVTGTFDGSLPVEFGGLGGRVVNGRIDSRTGGGKVEYIGELTNRDLGTMANFAFGALRSLTYDDLSITLNGALDGEMVTDIRFGGVGQGEGATRNFITRQVARIPMIFNVKIAAPFRSLFTTVKGLYDPAVQIEEKLPELFERQRAIEEEIARQQKIVQPLVSEPMP